MATISRAPPDRWFPEAPLSSKARAKIYDNKCEFAHMFGLTAGAGLTLLGHIPPAAVRRRLLRPQNRVSEPFKKLTLQWFGVKVAHHI